MRARGKRRAPGRSPVEAPAYKPPSLKERAQSHAEMATDSLIREHPLHKQMKKEMTKAIMGVVKGGAGSARGPAPQGRRTGIFS